MRMLRLILISSILIQLDFLVLAEGKDLTGTRASKYQFCSIEEVITTNIQQVGGNLPGSFSVQPSSGDKYSGIIFGTVNSDEIKANYLSVRKEDKAPQVIITFAESHIYRSKYFKRNYYVQDSETNALSEPFEAIRK